MAKKKINTTFSKYVLPSKNVELTSFSKAYKVDMMEQVVGSIEYAICYNLSLIEVFQFKNSDFVITISESDYLDNLHNIFQFYMNTEEFELCPRVVRLQKQITEKNNKNNEKKKSRS